GSPIEIQLRPKRPYIRQARRSAAKTNFLSPRNATVACERGDEATRRRTSSSIGSGANGSGRRWMSAAIAAQIRIAATATLARRKRRALHWIANWHADSWADAA